MISCYNNKVSSLFSVVDCNSLSGSKIVLLVRVAGSSKWSTVLLPLSAGMCWNSGVDSGVRSLLWNIVLKISITSKFVSYRISISSLTSYSNSCWLYSWILLLLLLGTILLILSRIFSRIFSSSSSFFISVIY